MVDTPYIKVMLYPCLTKYNAMKKYGEVEV
jgi:hypothetical protein